MRLIDAETLENLLTEFAHTAKTVHEVQMNALCFAAVRSESLTPTIDAVPVVRCKNCQKCTVWEDGHSFTCNEDEMDYYAPHYDAATYYCADGIRREDHGTEKADSQ